MEAHLVRPLRIGGKVHKEIFDIAGEIQIGSSEQANIIIPEIEPVHMIIEEKSDRHVISVVLSEAYVNGTKLRMGKNDHVLRHKDCIVLGDKTVGSVLIYKSEELEQMQQEAQQISLQDPSSYFGFTIPSKISAINSEFFTKCVVASKTAFGRYLINYLFQNFPIERAVLYSVFDNGMKWKPVFARAPEKFSRPSKKLITEVSRTKAAVIFNTKEEQDQNKSLSIVQQKISQAFVFPLLSNDKLIGALYLDTIESGDHQLTLTSDDFTIISSLIPGIAACLKCILISEKEIAKNEILLNNIVRSLITSDNKFQYRNIFLDNLIVYYQTSTQGSTIIFCEIQATRTAKLVLSIYLKHIMHILIDKADIMATKIISFLENIALGVERLDVTVINIENKGLEKFLHVSQNKDNKTIIGKIPLYGDSFIIMGQANETENEIVVKDEEFNCKDDYILILPSKESLDIFSELNMLEYNSRTIEYILKTIGEQTKSFALLSI